MTHSGISEETPSGRLAAKSTQLKAVSGGARSTEQEVAVQGGGAISLKASF
jgi:hypothetical protein